MTLDLTKLDEQMRKAGVIEDVQVASTTNYSPESDFQWPDLPGHKKRLDALPPAPIEAMPTVLRDICDDIAETFKVPIEVPMLNGLGLVGFAAGKYHLANIGSVIVRPNLYTACFQAPAERKSSGFSPLLKPVHEWIDEQLPEWRKNATGIEIRREKIRQLKKDIVCGKCENENISRLELDELENQTDEPNPNFVLGDATQGAMADRMSECGGQVLVASSDAKTILEIVLGKFTDGITEDGLMLQAYDGTEPFISSRRQSGTVAIPEPMMGIVIMTQLNQLTKLAAKGDIFSSGLISRFLFCFPDSFAGKIGPNGELIRKFSERELSVTITEQYRSFIHELLKCSFKMKSSIRVPVNSDAKKCWIEFCDDIERELGSGGEYGDCADVAGRLPIHAFRLALILAICHDPVHISICRSEMENGIKLAMYYWKHMERALGIMSKRNMPDVPRRIVASLQKNRETTLNIRAVQRRLNEVSADQIKDGIDWLLGNGYLREIKVVLGNNAGRPKNRDYAVNPRIHNG